MAKRILLTTGDLDGVGLEITIRSLKKTRIPRDTQIFVFCGEKFAPATVKALKRIAAGPFPSIYAAFQAAQRNLKAGVFIIGSKESPPLWVEECARICLAKKAQALVTGPLSKPLIKEAGLKDLGHTEILGRICGEKNLFMSFWGSKLNVVLLTGHVPLSEVSKALTADKVQLAFQLTKSFIQRWQGKLKKPIALVGLNPHAGDRGLIGEEEKIWMNELVTSSRGLEGPLPGDSAFIEANLKKYAAFLACYHDQGLIPFKMKHGFDEGVHITLGLPFLRTSVDHGPAKEYFGLGKANYGSMRNALEMAIETIS